MDKNWAALRDEISDIHGALAVHDAFIVAASRTLDMPHLALLQMAMTEEVEATRTFLLNSRASERMLAAVDLQADRFAKRLAGLRPEPY